MDILEQVRLWNFIDRNNYSEDDIIFNATTRLDVSYNLAGKFAYSDEKFNWVYFLINFDKIVYVGQTTRGSARILEHVQDRKKRFIKYFYLELEDSTYLDLLELHYIQKFQPKYNIKDNPKYKKCKIS